MIVHSCISMPGTAELKGVKVRDDPSQTVETISKRLFVCFKRICCCWKTNKFVPGRLLKWRFSSNFLRLTDISFVYFKAEEEDGEMAQQLRACAALAEDPSNIHVKNSRFSVANTFGPRVTCTRLYAHT